MRAIVIQNKENGLFVLENGIWIDDFDRALRFDSPEQACLYCLKNDLDEHRVIIVLAHAETAVA